jgi:hypothetical protein
LTRGDLALLAELERHDPEAARQFERLLDRQRRADTDVLTHEASAIDPIEVADQGHGHARAGVGRGRKRTTPPNPDQQETYDLHHAHDRRRARPAVHCVRDRSSRLRSRDLS